MKVKCNLGGDPIRLMEILCTRSANTKNKNHFKKKNKNGPPLTQQKKLSNRYKDRLKSGHTHRERVSCWSHRFWAGSPYCTRERPMFNPEKERKFDYSWMRHRRCRRRSYSYGVPKGRSLCVLFYRSCYVFSLCSRKQTSSRPVPSSSHII